MNDDAWRKYLKEAGVKPLNAQPRVTNTRVSGTASQRTARAQSVELSPASAPRNRASTAVNQELARRVASGAPIDATLDLHGLSALHAERQLLDFIAQARNHRAQLILIIHGKGKNSEHGIAVLKPLVIDLLTRIREVRAFTTAPRKNGGDGALIALLD